MACGAWITLASPGVRAAREANGAAGLREGMELDRPGDGFLAREAGSTALRGSFYVASVSRTGWPRIQHHGEPSGFLHVLDDGTLGSADFAGSRQYFAPATSPGRTGLALVLMDYPNRSRLEILARMAAHDLAAEPGLVRKVARRACSGCSNCFAR